MFSATAILNKLVPLADILRTYVEERFPEMCNEALFVSLTGEQSDPMVSIGRSFSTCGSAIAEDGPTFRLFNPDSEPSAFLGASDPCP